MTSQEGSIPRVWGDLDDQSRNLAQRGDQRSPPLDETPRPSPIGETSQSPPWGATGWRPSGLDPWGRGGLDLMKTTPQTWSQDPNSLPQFPSLLCSIKQAAPIKSPIQSQSGFCLNYMNLNTKHGQIQSTVAIDGHQCHKSHFFI